MSFNWLSQLNQIKEGVAKKAADAAKYVESVQAASKKRKQQDSEDGENSESYDEEDQDGTSDEEGKAAAQYDPIRKQAVEMRLIIKQALVTVLEINRKVRVELTRNGKKLSTDFKPVEEDTGITNIKQSFNQKVQENFDNESMKWIADLVELAVYYGDDLVGVCRFDLTRYIDLGARNEKVSMVEPGHEA